MSRPSDRKEAAMQPSPLRRTLVVANRTASTPDLLEEIERRAAERTTAFTLLVPDVAPSKAGDWTLNEALAALRRAAAGPSKMRVAHVDGRVAGPDPFEAIKQALADEDFDDVLISTLPARRSAWLRRDLPRRVQSLGVPVPVVPPPAQPRIGLKDLPMTGP